MELLNLQINNQTGDEKETATLFDQRKWEKTQHKEWCIIHIGFKSLKDSSAASQYKLFWNVKKRIPMDNFPPTQSTGVFHSKFSVSGSFLTYLVKGNDIIFLSKNEKCGVQQVAAFFEKLDNS